MNSSYWKSILASLTLATVTALSLGDGPFVRSLHAQEEEEVAPSQEEVLDEEETLEEEEESEEEEGDEETAAEEAESKPVEVKGPSADAKGAPATPYMHGVTDAKAIPIDLASLTTADVLQSHAAAEEALPSLGVGTGAILCLTQEEVKLANSLLKPEEINDSRGQILRFHVWIKGEEVAPEGNLWADAPALRLELVDNNGNVVASAVSTFKTRGTFPWHNYYMDMMVPRNVFLSSAAAAVVEKDQLLDMLGLASDTSIRQAGLYLTLLSRGTGKACFGGLSYEKVAKKDQKLSPEILDDATATFSPNPQYDELPMLLFYGLDTRLPWRFLDGNESFGSLRTVAGLEAYLQRAMNDWFHVQKGVAMLPYLYVTANTLKLSPDFEDGWLDTLRGKLEAAQNPETGLWHVDGVPNLLASAALARRCFSPKGIRHNDAVQQNTPWNAVAQDGELKLGVQIIRSLLKERVAGAAWNTFAFQSPELKSQFGENRAELLPTAAAVHLLAMARDTLSLEEEAYEEAEEAIQAAYDYAVENFVLRDGNLYLWKESNTQAQPAVAPAGMMELLNAARTLEHRVNDTLPRPVVTCRRRRSAGLGKADVTWANPEKGLVAIRIYAAPADFNPALLSEKHLIGVMERPRATPKNQDPLMLAYRLADGARKYWGVTPADLGVEYLEEKFATLASYVGGTKNLTAGTAGEKPVTMNVSSPLAFGYAEEEAETIPIKVYAVGVASSGELTPCIPLDADDEE
ncbi:MAG: hypothetical protein ACI4SG_07765 [Oligosphaeraceae bacterium]